MPTTTFLREPVTNFAEADRAYDSYRPIARYFRGERKSSRAVAWVIRWSPPGMIQYREVPQEGLDLEKANEDLERYAASSGVNLDLLLLAAGSHFERDTVLAGNTNLTNKELRELAEDDDQHTWGMS